MKDEKLALKVSVAAYLFMAILGIVFAIVARSDAIMLSGFFSLIAFVMGILSLKVAELVQLPGDERFHFGYAYFEPFLNAIKGLITLAVAALSLAAGVDAMLHGGRPINAGWAIVYASLATTTSIAVALLQHRTAKITHSPLIQVDVRNWILDGVVNAGVGVAFLIALLIVGTRWSFAVPYVDPILLTVIVLVLIWIPVKTVKESVLQLLQVAPPLSVQHEVRQRLDQTVEGLSLEKTYVRMMKIGRYFYVMNHLIVASSFRLSRVKELDDIRKRISDGLKDMHPRVVLDTIFTEDQALAE